jgi:hypothetical protein
MAAKLTRLTHKIAIRLHQVAESCAICSSRSRRPVRKLLDTPSYFKFKSISYCKLGISSHMNAENLRICRKLAANQQQYTLKIHDDCMKWLCYETDATLRKAPSWTQNLLLFLQRHFSSTLIILFWPMSAVTKTNQTNLTVTFTTVIKHIIQCETDM